MHPRAAELIYRTLLRVEARLAQQALGMDRIPDMPASQVVEADEVEPVQLAEQIAAPLDELDEPAPVPSGPLPPQAERISTLAGRGWTPQMVAHDLRLHPKLVRQIARDHFITFHCQR